MRVIGLLSGTSYDAVEVAAADLRQPPPPAAAPRRLVVRNNAGDGTLD